MIYPANNDIYHFFLQLTYLHTWFERGWSFNEPSWSVCSEVFVYILFFWFASRRAGGYVVASIVTVFIGIAAQPKWSLPLPPGNIARAMVGFFAGSLLYLGMVQVDRRGGGARLGWACLIALAVVLTLANLIGYEAWVGSGPLVHSLVIFPLLLVAALRVRPLSYVLSLRPLTFFGDISYAVYLCHAPLQMITLRDPRRAQAERAHKEPWVLGVYAVVLIAVATTAHYGLEIPAADGCARTGKPDALPAGSLGRQPEDAAALDVAAV